MCANTYTISSLRRSLRPETELLLCCSRVQFDASHRACILDLLQHRLSWVFLNREMGFHRVLPLVYRNLFRHARHLCPEEVLKGWHASSAAVLRYNVQLASDLLALATLFSREGIPLAAFKGPVAAIALYGDLGLRTFNDLDVLVPRAHACQAFSILQQHGYLPDCDPGSGWDAIFLRRYAERVFARKEPYSLLDLHWSLMPPGYSFTPATDEVWARLRQIPFGPSAMATLGVEDTLIHLCLHMAKHDWDRLCHVCDLAELLNGRPHLDWDRVLFWAASHHAGRLLHVSLLLAHGLLGAFLPGPVLARAQRNHRAVALASKAAHALLWPERRVAGGVRSPWSSLFFQGLERGSDRWRYVYDAILAPTVSDWKLIALPAFLAPVYYVIRPVRWLAKAFHQKVAQSV